MNTDITTYQFDDTPIRITTGPNGEPMFALADICKACGIGNPSDVMRRLDDDQKGVDTIDTLGGPQKINVVNESGLYDVILDSRKPEARRFRKWVTGEVLPSIRRHGGYMAGQEHMSPEQMALASMRWLQSKVDEQAAQLEAAHPKVVFADAVTTSNRCILIGELAKILKQNGVDTGEKRLFAWMRDNGYLMKRRGIPNMPTQRALDLGLYEVKETPIVHADGHTTLSFTTKVTPKGQIYFVNKLINH
ncbi:phage antirepressor KilAC domain-containing protein [Bifidobacterium pseudolongum]|uniref:Antirepressor n=1 Tax=Bifidobacterium pseudolongum subsp. globosum TaxID=1690 RepID=A0A4Q5ATV1_9BIFI|nr:phage antirepressor KilAC domain-containing protein [Bifidobacterium pseudolongum]RYQ36308.1 antirepressor [Bifidobacterium pseudolongum subsp. globosum]